MIKNGIKYEFENSDLDKIEALGSVLTVGQICDYFGISTQTFYRHVDERPEIMERYKKGKTDAITAVGHSLIDKARKGDTTAQMFYLKTQAGWRESSRVDHTSSDGSMGQPTRIEIVAPDTKDEGRSESTST